MSANPAGKVDDQHDYSSQWSAYYRNIGLIREAEAIESEIKHQKSGGMVKKADFSQEWLAFYRKNGLHEQAAEVERQIASKNESQESNASTTSQPTMTCDHDCEE